MYYLILLLLVMATGLLVIATGLVVYYFRLYLFGFKVEVDYTTNIQDFLETKGLKGLNLSYVDDMVMTHKPKEVYKPTKAKATISGGFRRLGGEEVMAKLDQNQERVLLVIEFLYILEKYRFAKFPQIIFVPSFVGFLGDDYLSLVSYFDRGQRELRLVWFGSGWLVNYHIAYYIATVCK